MGEYDSRPDTHEHIAKVRGYVNDVAIDLVHRADVHDASKLDTPERELFDEYTPKLAQMDYSGEPDSEYQQALKQMGPALQHHYATNDHHPEHFEAGIHDMSLVHLIEMLCDWKAAGERHADGGDIVRSIRMNAKRYGYGSEVENMLLNTAAYLGWIGPVEHAQ